MLFHHVDFLVFRENRVDVLFLPSPVLVELALQILGFAQGAVLKPRFLADFYGPLGSQVARNGPRPRAQLLLKQHQQLFLFISLMDKYQILDTLGTGSYGVVHRALNLQTQEIVAIKRLREPFDSYEECLKLREVRALLKLKEHPNLVKLIAIHYEHKQLHLIYEYIEINLYHYYLQERLDEASIRNIIRQCALALQYVHERGFFHRDLKPENLLLQNGNVKLIDFGMARELASKPPFTDYVSTRWYRAPEVLLHSETYDSAIDIFALGCIMAELYLGKPLIAGQSDVDQFTKMLHMLGTFAQNDWPEGWKLMTGLGVDTSFSRKAELCVVMKAASAPALNLLQGMLAWNPKKRLGAKQVLEHSYFEQGTPEFAFRKLQTQQVQQVQNQGLNRLFKQMNLDGQKRG